MIGGDKEINYGKMRPGFWMAFILVLSVTIIVLVFINSGPDLAETEEASPLTFNEVIRELDEAQLAKMVSSRFARVKQSPISIAIRELKEVLTIADHLEQTVESSEFQVRQMRLTAFSILDSLNVELDLEDLQIRPTLMSVAKAGLETDIPIVKRQCHFAIIAALANDLCKSKKDEQYAACKLAIDDSLDDLRDNKEWVQRLTGLFKILDQGDVAEHRKQLLLHIGNRLLQSEDPEIQTSAYFFNTHALFPSVDFERIESLYSYDQLDAILSRLENNIDVNESVFRAVLAVLERNSRQIVDEGRQNVVQRFKTICSGITRPDIKTNVQERIARFEKRWNLIDQEFVFSGQWLDGTDVIPSQFEGLPVLILYFSFNQKESALTMARLARSRLPVLTMQKKMAFIGVPVDLPREGHVELLKKRFPNSSFTMPNAQAEFNEQFEVDAVPYFVFLDDKHRVVDIAIKEETLGTFLQKRVGR